MHTTYAQHAASATLDQLDHDIEHFTERLSKAIDGDINLRRASSDHAETHRVSFNPGIDFELEPGDTLEAELVWFVECLASALGRKVVAK